MYSKANNYRWQHQGYVVNIYNCSNLRNIRCMCEYMCVVHVCWCVYMEDDPINVLYSQGSYRCVNIFIECLYFIWIKQRT